MQKHCKDFKIPVFLFLAKFSLMLNFSKLYLTFFMFSNITCLSSLNNNCDSKMWLQFDVYVRLNHLYILQIVNKIVYILWYEWNEEKIQYSNKSALFTFTFAIVLKSEQFQLKHLLQIIHATGVCTSWIYTHLHKST